MSSMVSFSGRARLSTGFLVAAALPLVGFAAPALIGSNWAFALLIFAIGGPLAAVTVLIAGVPLYIG